MELYCTRPGCPRPQNHYDHLDDSAILRAVENKYCTCCGMPLILKGCYLLIALIGKGGFGAGFLTLDLYTPIMRQCVVKQFQPAGCLNSIQLVTAHAI